MKFYLKNLPEVLYEIYFMYCQSVSVMVGKAIEADCSVSRSVS